MSVEIEPAHQTRRRSLDAAAATALRCRVDPRVAALVPRFDAPFFQAGLAGYSDSAMRLIARRHGCPFCVTEALLDRTLLNGGKGRAREDPDIIAAECGMGELDDNVAKTVDDHPLAGQIMGSHPEEMARAAAQLVGMGHDVVDVNLACPVKKIRSSHRGGHFLAHPDEAIAVLREVHAAVGGRVPCSVKLRRAYDDDPAMARHFERIFDAAYEIGYSWTTVHCRTVVQKYLGPGRWEFLAELVARRSDCVIFGSGDIWCVEDIFAMIEECGVTGVAVARGCIGNPWIFRQARQLMRGEEPMAPTIAQQREVLLDHLSLATTLHGERSAGQRMRKFAIRFASHHPSSAQVKGEFIRCESLEAWHAVLDLHYGPAATAP